MTVGFHYYPADTPTPLLLLLLLLLLLPPPSPPIVTAPTISGAGYHLVLVKAADCKVSKITETIQSFLPSARFESEVNMELSYLLPADHSHVFPTLFTLLEDRKDELRILSFGATATTMEEVFLR